ncbi:MAG TPA: hypothetical protein VKU19_31750 [Bryobacteraceae bacterium]|nr:hypothetical protein [Bryobacteraceae bacterium]
MHSARAVPLLLVCASFSAWGQGVIRLPGPPPLALPDWLAPFPQTRDLTAKATLTEVTSAYTALGNPSSVVSHYQQQMLAAGIDFQLKPEAAGTSIEGMGETTVGIVRIREDGGGAKVEVRYAVRHDPPPVPVDGRLMPPLPLEWPAWLEFPGGRIASQRTTSPGHIAKSGLQSCPGDVIGRPTQGCLARVYETSSQLKDVYTYFEGILAQQHYTTESASPEPYANLQLGKSIGDVFGSLTMRQYPVRGQDSYYRQINIFLRQPGSATGTKAEITFMVKNETLARISGTWIFTHLDRFEGTIVLRQTGTEFSGTWHTSKGKVEPDDSVAGNIDGNIVNLTRFIEGGDNRQTYVLTLSPDGNRLDGFGNGFFINHANLNMERVR